MRQSAGRIEVEVNPTEAVKVDGIVGYHPRVVALTGVDTFGERVVFLADRPLPEVESTLIDMGMRPTFDVEWSRILTL